MFPWALNSVTSFKKHWTIQQVYIFWINKQWFIYIITSYKTKSTQIPQHQNSPSSPPPCHENTPSQKTHPVDVNFSNFSAKSPLVRHTTGFLPWFFVYLSFFLGGGGKKFPKHPRKLTALPWTWTWLDYEISWRKLAPNFQGIFY